MPLILSIQIVFQIVSLRPAATVCCTDFGNAN